MSTALFFFILNMVALGGGPSTAGWLIDVFSDGRTELEAIRYAMTAICFMFALSVISFLFVAKHIKHDWAAAEKRNEGLAKTEA